MKPLNTLTDFVDRVTHWSEGGTDRHTAIQALAELRDEIEWTEKGLAEWRELAHANDKAASASEAALRIAVRHLQAVVNQSRTHAEQQAADTAAREWLTSIGSEPS